MTTKQTQILNSALQLFANDGYSATSTASIAKQANVSEGLIFRHFSNKQGLLLALVNEGEQEFNKLIAPILTESNAHKVLVKTICLPFEVPKNQYAFWRLQFKLKWENEFYNPEKIKPLIKKLTTAFKALKYDQPKQEAELLYQIMESTGISILRDGKQNILPQKKFLLNKYKSY